MPLKPSDLADAFEAGEFVASVTELMALEDPKKDYYGMLHGCFDERGKFADSEFICLTGLISNVPGLRSLSEQWVLALRRHGLTSMHTKDFMRPAPYQNTKYEKSKKIEILSELMGLIHTHTFSAWVVSLDCAAYRNLKPHERQMLGDNDPHLFIFFESMKAFIATLDEAQWTRPVAITIDDEEKYSIECYKLIKRVKSYRPEWRSRPGGICFLDDDNYQPLQAADLIAWVAGRQYREAEDREIWAALLDACLKDRGRAHLFNAENLSEWAQNGIANRNAAYQKMQEALDESDKRNQ
jgi:hypothetical protein